MSTTATSTAARVAHAHGTTAVILLGLLLVGLALALAAAYGRGAADHADRTRRAERFLNITEYERCANDKRRVWCRTDIDYSADLDDDALDATDISTCEFAASMRMQDEHNERVTDAIRAAVKDKDVTNSIVTLTAPLSTQSPTAATSGNSETVLVEEVDVEVEVDVNARENPNPNPEGLPPCSELCDDRVSPVDTNNPCEPGDSQCCAHDAQDTQEQLDKTRPGQRSGGYCYKPPSNSTDSCAPGTTRCFVDEDFRKTMNDHLNNK